MKLEREAEKTQYRFWQGAESEKGHGKEAPGIDIQMLLFLIL